MPSLATIVAFTVVNLGVLYQFFLKDVLFVAYGVSREMQPLSDFPFTCRRLTDHNLAACEDAWIDHSSRQMFLACSNALGRRAWNPAVGSLAADRRSQSDHIVALSLDTPHPQDPSAFDYRVLDLGSYTNAIGEKQINLVGMTGKALPDGTINLYFINNPPAFDLTTGLLLDPTVHGANSSIEAFSLAPGSSTLNHLHSFYNPTHITTPNRPAVLPDGSIMLTNDHGPDRAGIWHTLNPILGRGSLAHCLPPTSPGAHAKCAPIATADSHYFPNGLLYSETDNLLYVPSSIKGTVSIYELPHYASSTKSPGARAQAQKPLIAPADLNATAATIRKIQTLKLGMPIDNLSESPFTSSTSETELLIPGFPKLSQFEELTKQSTPIDGRGAPTTVWKLTRKNLGGPGEEGADREWKVEKFLEDSEGKVLPAATTAVRDAKTGRIFVVGVLSPWIAVCEPL